MSRWLVGNLKSVSSPVEHVPAEQSSSENTPPEDPGDEAEESPSMVETELKSEPPNNPIEEKTKDEKDKEQGGEDHE
ncbi:MAG: hypothetical protein VX189_11135 [Planctomycetota bacterium]|nr:hypothetical protein [Planctomycetota bacterium]